MNVSLTPELEDFVATQLKTGHYRSASEIVREALRNQIRHGATEKTNRRISFGREQVANGQVHVADDSYFESKRKRIRDKYIDKKENMSYCVIFAVYADKDLDGILDYIAQDSPIRAIEFVNSLQDRIKKTLGVFPNGGTRTGECRYITFDNYIVVYEVNEELSEVYVYLISEGHRQWRAVLDERV